MTEVDSGMFLSTNMIIYYWERDNMILFILSFSACNAVQNLNWNTFKLYPKQCSGLYFFFFLITAFEAFSFLLLCVLLLLLFIHSGITDSVWIMSYHWLPAECYNAICLIETWASPTWLQRIIHFLINQAFAKIPPSLTWNGGTDNAACELRGDGDKNAFFVQHYWIILWLVNCN